MENEELMTTQTLVLNRTTGEMEAETPSFTRGVGALLAKIGAAMKKGDRESVNAELTHGESETNEVDVTVVDNNTGAATRVTSNATVGADTEGVRFNRYGSKSALRLLLAVTGFNRENISNQLIDALASDDVPAVCAILGVSEKAIEAADELIETLGNESKVVVAGRQQVSKVEQTEMAAE